MKRTALAQLVELYAECRGVTSTKELAEVTGYTERAIRKAKAELEFRNQSSARNHSSGTRVPKAEPECRPLARAQAIPEDSNITNNNTTDSNSSENPAADGIDVDVWKLKVKLTNAAQNQPMNWMAALVDDFTPIQDLIREGYDLDAQIIPTIRKHRYKGGGTINGWKYWATIVRSTHASPSTGKPKPVRYAQETPDDLVTCYVN